MKCIHLSHTNEVCIIHDASVCWYLIQVLKLVLVNPAHTHTHTYIYIYIYCSVTMFAFDNNREGISRWTSPASCIEVTNDVTVVIGTAGRLLWRCNATEWDYHIFCRWDPLPIVHGSNDKSHVALLNCVLNYFCVISVSVLGRVVCSGIVMQSESHG